jgi:hypothetical protein
MPPKDHAIVQNPAATPNRTIQAKSSIATNGDMTLREMGTAVDREFRRAIGQNAVITRRDIS